MAYATAASLAESEAKNAEADHCFSFYYCSGATPLAAHCSQHKFCDFIRPNFVVWFLHIVPDEMGDHISPNDCQVQHPYVVRHRILEQGKKHQETQMILLLVANGSHLYIYIYI